MSTQQGVRMANWYGQPRAYDFRANVREQRKDHHYSLNFDYKFGVELGNAPALPARGSVILLHPWGMEGSALTTWALLFASAGYTVVMPDLRSHGESADAPVGYGPREADDIVDLVRDLRAAKRLPGPLYLFGVSYGGTVALFAAPKLAEVHGVIAIEPYASAATVIRRAPAGDLFGHRWLASWIRPREVDQAIQRASRQLGVDLAQPDPGDALAHTPSCALILRGAEDNLIAGDGLSELARRSPRASYVEVSQEGHLILPMRTDRLLPPLLDWMQGVPVDASGSCPGFMPLPFVTTPAADPIAAPKL
ncbi:alpha/beta fold hydrolase [Rhodanobacter sp. B04]|uniref:alpha/beta fold hydrolase n=1 Tax=Rhodanobacter sp. B04 TaxID=1945860 RepID=UPI0011155E34|nr:alpha/beta fold hydrolase [Rhodanobacter sp. B04]